MMLNASQNDMTAACVRHARNSLTELGRVDVDALTDVELARWLGRLQYHVTRLIDATANTVTLDDMRAMIKATAAAAYARGRDERAGDGA